MPSGVILGQMFRNIFDDKVLAIELPKRCCTIDFDYVLVLIARVDCKEDLVRRTDHTLNDVNL